VKEASEDDVTVAERSPFLGTAMGQDDAQAWYEAVRMIRDHPAFPAALRHLLADQMAALANTPSARQLGDDRGKYHLAIVALGLHASLDRRDPRSGLTGERLRRLCTELQLCSRGRVLSLIQGLKAAGHLEQAPASGDGRVRRMLPTPLMLAFHTERLRAQFAATMLVMPEEAPLFAMIELPRDVAAMAAAQVAVLASGRRQLGPTSVFARIADTTAAISMLVELAATGLGGRSDAALPDGFEARLSISALSRRHAVSRKHVLKVVTLSEEAGLLHRPVPGGDRVEIRSALIEEIAAFAAGMMLTTAVTAEAIVAARQGGRVG
jgi:hypothetical protein